MTNFFIIFTKICIIGIIWLITSTIINNITINNDMSKFEDKINVIIANAMNYTVILFIVKLIFKIKTPDETLLFIMLIVTSISTLIMSYFKIRTIEHTNKDETNSKSFIIDCEILIICLLLNFLIMIFYNI